MRLLGHHRRRGSTAPHTPRKRIKSIKAPKSQELHEPARTRNLIVVVEKEIYMSIHERRWHYNARRPIRPLHAWDDKGRGSDPK
jgi:hypothetical protein